MIRLGLSRTELRAFHKLLQSNHYVHIRMQILDLDHNYVGDISSRIVEGQINVDADADVTRSLDCTLFDPNHAMHFDSKSPDDGALYMDRMVRIFYCVAPPDLSTWYNVPVFCGPLTKVERNGLFITIEAQGKEMLSFPSVWRTKSYKKGLAKTTVIRRNFVDVSGEKKVDIPNYKERIPRHMSLGVASSPWKVNKALAHSLTCQLFYDGRGVARLRKIPHHPAFTFTENNMKTEATISFDTEKIINSVLVIGGKPKGSKKRIRVKAVAKASHPLSPRSLQRGGKWRYIPEVVKNDAIRTKSKARAVARQRLKSGLIESVEVTFDSLVIPHLEPLDVCRLNTEAASTVFRLRQFTIPLTIDGASSIGYIARVTPRKRRRPIRGRRRRGRGNG